MVEHAWIRLAELKEEAAAEDWERAHPVLARWRPRLLYARAKLLLLRKWCVEHERFQSFLRLLRRGTLVCHMVLTRCGCRPSRRIAQLLTTRELIEELDIRRLDRGDCVERGDLLDVLCGAAEHAQEASPCLLAKEESITEVDKMV